MYVEDVEADRSAPVRNLDDGVLRPTTFAPRVGQIDVALSADGKPREGCVSVAAFLHGVVHAHGAVFVVQCFGDGGGEIEMVRSGDASIDLLQERDVGVVPLEDRDDAFGSERAVHADGFVDIVCDETKPHDVPS